jgi:uncharacterized protein (TIGR02596 family)
MITRQPPRQASRAFSLAEMLVVVSIISALLLFSINSLRGTLQAQNLSSAATLLQNELRMTAILAVKENRAIYLRFLTATPDNPAPPYRGWQLVALDPVTGLLTDISAPQRLPSGIIFIDHEDYSNIHKLEPSLGPGLFFGFTPDGDTTLSKTSTARWCLTLVEESKAAAKPGALPKNYRALVIDAYTGNVSVY